MLLLLLICRCAYKFFSGEIPGWSWYTINRGTSRDVSVYILFVFPLIFLPHLIPPHNSVSFFQTCVGSVYNCLFSGLTQSSLHEPVINSRWQQAPLSACCVRVSPVTRGRVTITSCLTGCEVCYHNILSDRVWSLLSSYGCPSVSKYVEVITLITGHAPWEPVSLPKSDVLCLYNKAWQAAYFLQSLQGLNLSSALYKSPCNLNILFVVFGLHFKTLKKLT